MPVTDPRDAVLVAASDRPRADTAEDGYATIRALTATDFSDAALADAVAGCVAEGLLRDPVRLEQGALQCHWRAELTPAGVEAARIASMTANSTVMPGLDPGIQRGFEQVARSLDCRIKSGNDDAQNAGNEDAGSTRATQST